MITLYLWDSESIFYKIVEADPMGELPPRSTSTKPPELTGTEVARWIGFGWEVLPVRPWPEIPVVIIAPEQVDDEATRRILLGFTFQNHPIAYRSTDRTEILSNAQIAFMAIVGGAQPGDLRWADDNNDFNYIAADNTLIPMDAGTAAELHRVASARRRQIMLAARELKIKTTVPLDYIDDKWWP